ncbi:Carboxylesterase type B [Penicillium argentinense]|uniref:Carboxylic ester hydrolase n=1 Tax=Penicillium argentinense TaxID=1131581 RepID=A0A9W9ENW1_9EURO|nr:Carboxylesterase type B [Penicillium argentinense]KAJ5085251.1 Carboxylesterase type B [Penicillium argentinense]
MQFWKPIGSIAFLASCLPAVWAGQVGATVKTTSGRIQGHVAERKPAVSEYLGIPYAAAPIGDLRFAAPVSYRSNGSTIHAHSYSVDCPANSAQPPDYPGFTPQAKRIMREFTTGNEQGEDCLYMNIWTRPTVKPKPVLMFIHGGRFTIGGAHSPYYDGQGLANDQDVVVVTFNYRLNIFGFSGAPGLPQNIGLLDQRMAVEWVHRNIAAFGGDPERITIFGQSAGGASVDYYAYAWKEKPLVAGLISHSGTALSFVPNTPSQTANYFYTVSKTLGCGDSRTEPHKVIECIRGKSWKEVVKATAKVSFAPSPALPQPVFHPTVDNVTVFNDYPSRSRKGEFASIPYLATSNNYEPGFYRISAFANNISLTDTEWDRFNLAGFTCASKYAVDGRLAYAVPAWQSRYFGDWDSQYLYDGSGAYHGSDIPMLFGSGEEVTGIPNSELQEKYSNYMGATWVAFASDPRRGLEKQGWPAFDASKPKRTIVGLGFKNGTLAKFLDPADVEKECAALHGSSLPGKGGF